MKPLILTIFLLFFISCSNSVDSNCEKEWIGGIGQIKIPDTIIVNKEYAIEVTYGAPSSCYSLKEITDTFTENGLIINAIICYEQKSGEECMQSPIENTIEKRIVFSKSGSFDVFINDTVFVKQVWVI